MIQTTARVTVTRTRQSIGAQLREHFETNGIAFELVTHLGANAYRVDGEILTPGQAADRYLTGGFAGSYGRR